MRLHKKMVQMDCTSNSSQAMLQNYPLQCVIQLVYNEISAISSRARIMPQSIKQSTYAQLTMKPWKRLNIRRSKRFLSGNLSMYIFRETATFPCTDPYMKYMPANSAFVQQRMLLEISSENNYSSHWSSFIDWI